MKTPFLRVVVEIDFSETGIAPGEIADTLEWLPSNLRNQLGKDLLGITPDPNNPLCLRVEIEEGEEGQSLQVNYRAVKYVTHYCPDCDKPLEGERMRPEDWALVTTEDLTYCECEARASILKEGVFIYDQPTAD